MINDTKNVTPGSPSNIKDQFNPLKEVQQRSPVTSPHSPLSLSPSLRRSSRKAKCRRESKLHLLPVEYSSDGSEGSLSDLEDILTRNVLDFPIHENFEVDILINSVDHTNLEVDLWFDTTSADDELSVDEAAATMDPKVRKKVKKKTDLKMSPRRAILLKQTETKLTETKTITPRTKSKHKSQTIPLPIPLAVRLVYHGRNFIPLTEFEEVDHELDCDFTWLSLYTRKLLDDITDVNQAEKTLMTMWNEHVVKYDGMGKVNLRRLLWEFVDFHFHIISDLNLYCNFICHMTAMQQIGLITMETVVDTVMRMQELMINRSQKNPSDSVKDLAVLFPSLELDPITIIPSSVKHQNIENSGDEDDPFYSSFTTLNISLEEASESHKERADLSALLFKKMENCSIE